MGDIFSSMDISASGLSAERLRMNIISNNLANANTTAGPDGKPYARKLVLFREMLDDTLSSVNKSGNGVQVLGVADSKEPFKKIYDPSHPDADKDGFVQYPNVNPVEEMVDMITASRSYEANLAAFNAGKMMLTKALDMGVQ